ncbi:MAG: Do family serine endopeptidase [Verrucomicrobia bacterium]|jgi:serine protease Do/serine protease DegQ|nr:Do family serine endopeptidase [Verrucomicrobiota bacterium]
MKLLVPVASFLLITLQSACADGNAPLKVDVDDRAMEDGSKQVVSYADVLEEATPSVVAVYTSRVVAAREMMQLPDILRQFGYRLPPSAQQEPPRERKQRLGVGSGVIISADGYIVTNHHVVQGMRGRMADEIKVRLEDNTEYVAEFIGSDPKTDVAVLKIEAPVELPAVQLADSDGLRVGDVVFAIGNPLDVGLTATQGIVSATGRNQGGRVLGPGSYEDFIQTDAAINLGNSGGALIDAWGRLVGINTAIVSGSGGNIGIGFAIPMNMVLNVATNLIETGEVPRGMLGLFPGDLSPEMAEAFGLENTLGALVNQVQEGSPASRAGIRHGDVITRIDGEAVASAAELRLTVSQILPGTEVDVTLIRDGDTKVVPVVLGSLNGAMGAAPGGGSPLEGVEMRMLDRELRAEYSIPDGVSGALITQVSPESPYADKLQPQMVIIEANGRAVSDLESISNSLRANAQNLLYVWAEGVMRFVSLRL